MSKSRKPLLQSYRGRPSRSTPSHSEHEIGMLLFLLPAIFEAAYDHWRRLPHAQWLRCCNVTYTAKLASKRFFCVLSMASSDGRNVPSASISGQTWILSPDWLLVVAVHRSGRHFTRC